MILNLFGPIRQPDIHSLTEMAPDVEELIKRVNTLTLDKIRLKQKLTQLTNDHNGKEAILRLNHMSMKANQNSPLNSSLESNSHSLKSISDILSFTSSNSEQSPTRTQDVSTDPSSPKCKPGTNLTAGVECTTSCDDDILYVNDIMRKKIDEFNDNWDYIQSKCSALLAELNALQVHYGRLKNEKMELEEKHKKKCEECDDIKSELQTVVLNYETQLSAMSEHLSAITSRQIN